MGIGDSFGEAFAKASLGASDILPLGGRAFLSVKDSDKENVLAVARDLVDLGFLWLGHQALREFCLQQTLNAARFRRSTKADLTFPTC